MSDDPKDQAAPVGPGAGPRLTRRRLLGGGVALGGAALAGASLPINVRKALAAPLPSSRPSLRDIEHVVLLMQENRSFDHYFGTFSGVRGFADAKRAEAGERTQRLLPARPRTIRTAICCRTTSTP